MPAAARAAGGCDAIHINVELGVRVCVRICIWVRGTNPEPNRREDQEYSSQLSNNSRPTDINDRLLVKV